MNKKAPEVKVYGVGVTNKGNAVVRAIIDGSKFDIPTNALTMAKLAERGVPVINGEG